MKLEVAKRKGFEKFDRKKPCLFLVALQAAFFNQFQFFLLVRDFDKILFILKLKITSSLSSWDIGTPPLPPTTYWQG